jgi:hypothetical protein
MKHKHHIIPKHMGGSNDPSNLVEVTVTQHAMFHFCNFQLWKKEEDKFAWLGLVGYLPKKELVSKLISHSNKTRAISKQQRAKLSKAMTERWQNPAHQEKLRNKALESLVQAGLASQSLFAKQKRQETFKLINHQQGTKNSMYGTMWITDGTKKNSYRISKTAAVPPGYRKGRVCK